MLTYTRYLDKDEFEDCYEIDENGCWIWKKNLDNWGYGHVYGHGGAHRVSYMIYKGRIPRGMIVCHTCDVPACVNPNHLWVGTTKENAMDRQRKGRGNTARGDKHGLRLHPEKVARGNRHSSRLHPEKIPRGLNHWTRKKEGRSKRIKLDFDKADFIRESYKNNQFSITELSKMFGVIETTIQRVIDNQRWIR